MNLNYLWSQKLRYADNELVWDLILVVDWINKILKNKSYTVNFYAFIRTDVVDSVLPYGYDINKCIEDYG